MALGTPVVATDCASGPSEILADAPRGVARGAMLTDYGILTPPGDLSAFMSALQMASNPHLQISLGRAAYLRAQQYDPAEISLQYWGVLREALATKRGYREDRAPVRASALTA
jgi:N-acetylgalactosamine-N,N'-diacetylbacillosaminyl-diphospho-undecaprenol 4-alpha-N-acetylgalactosaminyltransferase